MAFLHKKGLIIKSSSAASVGKTKKPIGPAALFSFNLMSPFNFQIVLS